jgi:hypothetical protein
MRRSTLCWTLKMKCFFLLKLSLKTTVCYDSICKETYDSVNIFIHLSRMTLRYWVHFLAAKHIFCSQLIISKSFSKKLFGIGLMVFNSTFNNISVISWGPVLLAEKTGVPGENHRPALSHWSTLSHNADSSTPCHGIFIHLSRRTLRYWVHFLAAKHIFCSQLIISKCSFKHV